MTLDETLHRNIKNNRQVETKEWIKKLLQPSQLVGDLYSMNYEKARVIIHDTHRHRVGGIPSLSFLVASRLNPNDCDKVDFKDEETSFILLRVIDSATLPQDSESERIRVEVARQVSGDSAKHWDDKTAMDLKTKDYLSYAGILCRIIGTFYLDNDSNNRESPLQLKFGSDISNYYPNHGLKVYKPNGDTLKEIVNYIDPQVKQQNYEKFGNESRVRIGFVRYASTNRKHQNIDNVPIFVYPADLLSQKTALFGMTRTGKSNTTKIIAKSVFELRKHPIKGNDNRIGQLIFDPNGEYANENEQDNNNAIKNVWKLLDNGNKENEVVTYGITTHDNDKDRRLMKLNFYLDENLQIGKEIIDGILSNSGSGDRIYIKNFIQVNLERPENADEFGSDMTRHKRRILAYRAILKRAGFSIPDNLKPITTKLFNADLIKAMENSNSDNAEEYKIAAKCFASDSPNWDKIGNAFETLDKFIRDDKSGYKAFNDGYVSNPNKSGENWADEDFKKIIGIFQYHNGTRIIGGAKEQHSPNTTNDYTDDIYADLKAGKLVIIDQSCGDPELNKSSAKRIITKIFRNNQQQFIKNEAIPEILVYVEEAHNILPAGNDIKLDDMWVRTAKEGAKYKIGMVYATQEVSSIQKNILKNTANWFISHLNNTDETKELCKYYDFADFEPSIRKAQDKGFLRVKTLSNLFVIPVQVDKFDIEIK